MTELSISIVTYNTKDYLRDCITSIVRDGLPVSYRITVVDNNSSDGTALMLNREFPEIRLMANKENLGYAKANNLVMQEKARFYLVVNPDTVMLPGAIAQMLAFMEKNPRVAICGPKIYNPDMTIQRTGEKFPDILYGLFKLLFLHTIFPDNPVKKRIVYDNWNTDTVREVDALNGACMLVRQEAVEEAGMMDENFLLFFEEIDWCLRMRKKGWKTCVLPFAEIIHHIGRSRVTEKSSRKEKIYYESMLYYYRKHYGFLVFAVFKVIFCLFTLLVHRIWKAAKKNG